VNVVCHACSFYYAVEISGRAQRTDCPQCGAFAGAPDPEGGLMVKCVCGRCGSGYPVDAIAERASLVCPVCGGAAKRRDSDLLRRLGEVWRLRRLLPGRPARAAGRVNLGEMEISADLVARVPRSVAFAYRCVPVRFENDVLTVALAEPERSGVLDDLALVLRCTVHGGYAPAQEIDEALRRCYGPRGGPRLT